jgi:hypothetical protein
LTRRFFILNRRKGEAFFDGRSIEKCFAPTLVFFRLTFHRVFRIMVSHLDSERITMSPRRSVIKKQEKQSGLPTWAIVVGIGALVVIAAGVLFVVQTPGVAPTVDVTKVGNVKGNANAPVEIIEVSDFQ